MAEQFPKLFAIKTGLEPVIVIYMGFIPIHTFRVRLPIPPPDHLKITYLESSTSSTPNKHNCLVPVFNITTL